MKRCVLILVLLISSYIASAQQDTGGKTYIYNNPGINGPYYSFQGGLPITSPEAVLEYSGIIESNIYTMDSSAKNFIFFLTKMGEVLINFLPNILVLFAGLCYSASILYLCIKTLLSGGRTSVMIGILGFIIMLGVAALIFSVRDKLYTKAVDFFFDVPSIVSELVVDRTLSTLAQNEVAGKSVFAPENISISSTDSNTSNLSLDYKFGVADFNVEERTTTIDFGLPNFVNIQDKAISFIGGWFVRIMLFIAYLVIMFIKTVSQIMIAWRLIAILLMTPFLGYKSAWQPAVLDNLKGIIQWSMYLVMMGVVAAVVLVGINLGISPLLNAPTTATAVGFKYGYFILAVLISFFLTYVTYRISSKVAEMVAPFNKGGGLQTARQPSALSNAAKLASMATPVGAAAALASNAVATANGGGMGGSSYNIGLSSPRENDDAMMRSMYNNYQNAPQGGGGWGGSGERIVNPLPNEPSFIPREQYNNAESPNNYGARNSNQESEKPRTIRDRVSSIISAAGDAKLSYRRAVHTTKSIIDTPLKVASALTGGPKDSEGRLHHDTFFNPIYKGEMRYENTGMGAKPQAPKPPKTNPPIPVRSYYSQDNNSGQGNKLLNGGTQKMIDITPSYTTDNGSGIFYKPDDNKPSDPDDK